MALETVAHIDDLVDTNPLTADPRSEGDDHIRNIKKALLADFANVDAACNPNPTEFNYLVGVTSLIQTALDAKALLAGAAGQDFNIKILTMANLLKFKAGADIASAGTLVINTATGNVILITGTTTTTAVTMDAGQIMVAVAGGAWPLTYHATNLKINTGGVNYTCEAGDIILFCKSLAGVVYGLIIPVDGQSPIAPATTTAATQAQQEAASDNTVMATPSNQHHHLSSAKVWASAGVTGSVFRSYNLTSVTDHGIGDITFTFATDFSDNNCVCLVNSNYTKGLVNGVSNAQGVGTYRAQTHQGAIPAVKDPLTRWSFAAFGDQA